MPLCEYGCGQEAKHQFNNGKWCCGETTNSCPTVRSKIGKTQIGKKNPKPEKIENIEGILCSFGCNYPAKYKFKSGNYCCCENSKTCPVQRKINSEYRKGRPRIESKRIENSENFLCYYGCGQIAKYIFVNGRLCCSKIWNSCPENSKKRKYTIDDYSIKFPIFSKEEEMRYHPETGEIQVHCKNHNCKNSKEQDGWFTPTRIQLDERIRTINHPLGKDGAYFYCCDECKQECPLFNLRSDPFETQKKELPYTDQEYNIWRQEVLTRQKDELGHNECEICHNRKLKELQVHHEIPIKKNWIFSLDPDNGIILCVKKERQKEEETCHFKYGHKTGTSCSTGNLANVICT
jgi:hypothetical protein